MKGMGLQTFSKNRQWRRPTWRSAPECF